LRDARGGLPFKERCAAGRAALLTEHLIDRLWPDGICGTQAFDKRLKNCKRCAAGLVGLGMAPQLLRGSGRMPLIVVFALVMGAGAFLWVLQRKLTCDRELARLRQDLAVEAARSRDAENQQQFLFSSNPYPMWTYDCATLRFVSVNDAAVRTYGFSREEFLEMSLLDIGPPAEVPTLLDCVNQIHLGFNSAGIWRHRRKDGSLLFADIRAFRFEQNGRDYELVLSHDVTERKLMEEALRQSQASLQSLVDGAPFGICQTSLDEDRVESVNPAMLNILGGYSLDEAMGLKISAQVYSDPKDRGRFIELLRRNGKIQGYELTLVRRDGSTLPVRITGSVKRNPQTKKEYFAGYVEDMTHQSVLEQQVRQVQKLEAVGRLAGGVAHDFNNILVVIKLSTELMLAQTTPDNPLSKPLLQVSNAADRAAALTRQMLALGRQQIMQVRVINVNSVVSETSHMLRRIIGEDIRLVTKLCDTLENSRLDPDQVGQVILNLAVNARDAMPDGGILHLETSNVDLDNAYTHEHPPVQPGRYVMLAVSDTGTGIDKSILARIFDPFFTTKDVGKGTGLGLSIVYGIVKQSGGYIWVYSEPGHGTTFKLYFPAITAPLENSVARSERACEPGGQTVLIVEDEATIRSNVRDCLRQLGYQVVEAENGEAALQVCDDLQGKIDLVLTDLVMPGMGGHELAGELAQRYPVVRMLFMSGYTEDSAARRDILLQGSAFLQKPFSVADLANAVHNALAVPAVTA
jgi:PAS domain S-box-containing protein